MPTFCYSLIDSPMKLFIVGGVDANGRIVRSSFAVDLSGYWDHCPAQGDFPISTFQMVMDLKTKTGQPVVCGGSESRQCYDYDFGSKHWQSFARFGLAVGARGAPLPDGSFWILGGRDTQSKSVYYDGVSTISKGPNLPFNFYESCVFQINDQESLAVYEESWIYNHAKKTFRQVSNFNWQSPLTPRNWHAAACGMTYDQAGNPEYAVLAGGQTAQVKQTSVIYLSLMLLTFVFSGLCPTVPYYL